MTTSLATLKSTIADDLERGDLTAQIAGAINTAIDLYATERFYFNETRGSTFVTVAAQSRYTVSDDADIPKWVKLDEVFLEDSSSNRYVLGRNPNPSEVEWLLDASAATGRPYQYAYFDQSFYLYPIPDAVYTVRPMGVIKKAAPTDDADETNVWITEAFELIRCAAPMYIAMHTIIDPDLLQRAAGGQKLALSRIRSETSRKVSSGRIEPTSF